MTATQLPTSGGVLDIELVERETSLPYGEEEVHVVAGSGWCIACKNEGRKPGCHGYTRGNQTNICGTCGHHYDRHM